MAKYTLHQVTNPPLNKSHGKMVGVPQYITIHNTANDAPARNEASYAANSTNPVSFHYAVDESEAWLIMPLNYSAWHASDHKGSGNTRSIAIEIARSLDYKTDRYARAEDNAAHLAATLLKKYNLGIDKLRRHYDWDPAKYKKRCPHRMFERTNGWEQFKRQVGGYLDKLAEPQSTKAPNAPSGSANYSHAQQIQAGAFKKKENAIAMTERIKRGGITDVRYVHNADGLYRVYAGVFNNPNYLKDRVDSLDKLGIKTSITPLDRIIHKDSVSRAKTTEELAQEVLQGKHGNGIARKNSLGNRYTEVQNFINQMYDKKKLKSVQEIAKEVWAGKWGNGTERSKRLKEAGYDPSQIQREVNKGIR